MNTSRHHVVARLGMATTLIVTAAFAIGMQRGEPPRITVMTWNIYDGAGDINGPPDMSEVWQSVSDTRFSARVERIVQTIDERRPHIVCLQEVAHWTGLIDLDPVNDDFLARIQSRLLARGLNYDVVGALKAIDHNGVIDNDPPFGSSLRWRESIVILAKHSPQIEILNVRTRRFSDIYATTMEFQRGWIAADISYHGKRARYVCTHLEEHSSSVRDHQAAQLIDWLNGTSQPVIVMGDLSGDPSSGIYAQFTDAGYSDAWLEYHGLLEGPTCCQASDLANSASELSERTDFVFVRGALTTMWANRVGHKQADRTPPPNSLWPSDHAGVVAKVQLD